LKFLLRLVHQQPSRSLLVSVLVRSGLCWLTVHFLLDIVAFFGSSLGHVCPATIYPHVYSSINMRRSFSVTLSIFVHAIVGAFAALNPITNLQITNTAVTPDGFSRSFVYHSCGHVSESLTVSPQCHRCSGATPWTSVSRPQSTHLQIIWLPLRASHLGCRVLNSKST
jgi:hypothetical protein